jgi:lipopolysaccharide export system permease protein
MLQSMPFILPEMLGITIPVAMLYSVSSVFGRMTGANEIVALKSLGINPMAAVWPVLALAAFTSLGTIWMYEIAATWCRPHFRQLVCNSIEEIACCRLQKKLSYDGDMFSIVVKGVENRNGRQILIKPTITLKNQSGQHKFTITAAEAEFHTNWKAGTLEIICRNGEVDVDDGHFKAFVGEQLYAVPLPTPAWDHRHRDWAASRDIPGLIAGIQAEIVPLQKTLRSLESLRKASQALGLPASPDDSAQIAAQIADRQRLIYRLRTEPYRRWSNGFTCLCFALIGMPVAMLWRHADGLTNFFVCFLPILAVYYPLLMIGEDLSTSGTLPPISFWMGNVLLAVPAVALLRWIVRH